jgi:DNA-binding PadR family transcriptional regulator
MNTSTVDSVARWKSRLNAILIEYLIFSTLSKQSTYGAAILETSQKLFDNVKVPTVYAIIKRSIEYKLIEKLPEQEKADKTRGTARQYYALTNEGIDYLLEIRTYLQRLNESDPLKIMEEKL